METYSKMIARIRREDAQTRSVARSGPGAAGGCLLGDSRDCAERGCLGCGWSKRETLRRARLPLWRDPKTLLFRKRVGRR